MHIQSKQRHLEALTYKYKLVSQCECISKHWEWKQDLKIICLQQNSKTSKLEISIQWGIGGQYYWEGILGSTM